MVGENRLGKLVLQMGRGVGDFGCWILNFGFGNVALLRSVSVNLAELRRAPVSGGAPSAGGLWENVDQ